MFEHSKANTNVINLNLPERLKNKHVMHEFLDNRRIATNLAQRMRIEFLYKSLSCLYSKNTLKR